MSFQKEHSHKYQVLRCECGTHYMELSYYPEDEHEKIEAFLNVQITQMSLWWRIKWAVKYIFNMTNNWQEFAIGNEYDFVRFKRFVDEIYKELVNNKEII